MRRRLRPAFTLIELIITLTVAGVLAAVGGVFILESFKAWQQFQFRADTGLQARLGLDWLVRELRETAVDDTGAPVIATASATTYSCTHVLGSGTSEALSFSWSGTSGAPLLRNAATLIPALTMLAFAYYDKNDAALTPLPLSAANRQQVRRIVVTMTVQNDLLPSDTMKLKGEAYLRSPYN